MGIFPAVVDILRAEHAHRPIAGDFLLIGVQKIELTGARRKEQHGLTDRGLLAEMCPLAAVKALDVSSYEGAEIVQDLCHKLPEDLHGVADFIYDGSCLDNIWDAAQAMRSLSAMLRSGGRMLMMEHGTAIQGALQCFSPEWFFDFFAVNRYADCQIKLGTFGKISHDWKVRDWTPFDADGDAVSATPGVGDFVNLVLAEKDADSVDGESPIQGQYRIAHDSSSSVYLDAHRRYMASTRKTR